MKSDIEIGIDICKSNKKGKLAVIIAMLKRRSSVSDLVNKMLDGIPDVSEKELISSVKVIKEEKNG